MPVGHHHIDVFGVLMCGMISTVIPKFCLKLEKARLVFMNVLRQTALTFEVSATTVLTFEVITYHDELCKLK